MVSIMDNKWEEVKKYVSKRYPNASIAKFWEMTSFYYEAGFPMLDGSTSEEDIVKDISSSITGNNGQDATKIAQSAVELAKNKMPQQVKPETPEYGAMMKGLASQYAGADQNQQNSFNSQQTSITRSGSITGNSSFTEDNFYKRTQIVVQNTGSDITVYNRDKFDFSLSSNKNTATAIALEHGDSFEVKLRVITKGSSMWPAPWRELEQKGIDSVLRIFIEGLSIQSQTMNNDPDRYIGAQHFTSLSKTIAKILETYNKLWGRTHYQFVVIGTNLTNRIPLIMSSADEIDKLQGFTIKKDITEILNKKATAQWRDFTWVAIRNASGKAIKEEVTSDAFMDTVPENARVIGMPSNEINSKAKKNINKMKKYGFSAQLENTMKEKSLIDTPVIKPETNRTYYLKFPDGTVRAFDNKEEKDYYKDSHPESESILASEFFDSLLDNEGELNIDDAIHFDDKVVPIATFQKDVKAKTL